MSDRKCSWPFARRLHGQLPSGAQFCSKRVSYSCRVTGELDSDDWYEKEQLHRAAQHGDVREVRRLIAEGAALNHFDEISFTPLHYAAACGHIEVMKVLLLAGADVNARQEEMSGDTALKKVAYSCR